MRTLCNIASTILIFGFNSRRDNDSGVTTEDVTVTADHSTATVTPEPSIAAVTPEHSTTITAPTSVTPPAGVPATQSGSTVGKCNIIGDCRVVDILSILCWHLHCVH